MNTAKFARTGATYELLNGVQLVVVDQTVATLVIVVLGPAGEPAGDCERISRAEWAQMQASQLTAGLPLH